MAELIPSAKTVAALKEIAAHELAELLKATTLSCSGTDVTILCSDHDTKDAIMERLEQLAYGE